MFAVPGWNVPVTGPIQQKTGSKNAKNGLRDAVESDSENENPRKRKRADEKPTKVTGDHLETLWNAKFGKHPTRHTHDSEKAERLQSSKKSKDHDVEAVKDRVGASNTKNVRSDQDAIEEMPVKVKRQDKREKRPKTLTTGLLHDKSSPSYDESKIFQLSKVLEKQKSKEVLRSAQPTTSKAVTEAQAILPPSLPTSLSKLTTLQSKMREKLTSSRFRHLNQTLYTTTSSSALQMFRENPELFAEYHAGFAQQVKSSWPQNPVNTYIQNIQIRGSLQDGADWKGLRPLPRRKTGSCTIADLGCGDAPLARALQSEIKDLQLKLHNLDLHAANALITVADISNLPLRDGEADIAIFCLSLMGTNWISFVEEAWRVLRGDGKGEVWVAEVKSRFGRVRKAKVVDNSVGKKRKVPQQKAREEEEAEQGVFAEDIDKEEAKGNETDISAFVDVFQRRGFVLRPESVNKSNKMFVSMIFVKAGVPTAGKYKGLKWNGKEYKKIEAQSQPGKTKFISKRGEDEDEVDPETEAKVLKPCVYKTR